jgi:hypothetical protein
MLLLVCWVIICAQYFGDYSSIKGSWRESAVDWITLACAIAYCVNVFVPPVKIIRHDNEFLRIIRTVNWFFWMWKLLKIFSGYVFIAVFLVPILFWIFCNYYVQGLLDNWDTWVALKADDGLGRWALTGFSLWWLTLIVRLGKIATW